MAIIVTSDNKVWTLNNKALADNRILGNMDYAGQSINFVSTTGSRWEFTTSCDNPRYGWIPLIMRVKYSNDSCDYLRLRLFQDGDESQEMAYYYTYNGQYYNVGIEAETTGLRFFLNALPNTSSITSKEVCMWMPILRNVSITPNQLMITNDTGEIITDGSNIIVLKRGYQQRGSTDIYDVPPGHIALAMPINQPQGDYIGVAIDVDSTTSSWAGNCYTCNLTAGVIDATDSTLYEYYAPIIVPTPAWGSSYTQANQILGQNVYEPSVSYTAPLMSSQGVLTTLIDTSHHIESMCYGYVAILDCGSGSCYYTVDKGFFNASSSGSIYSDHNGTTISNATFGSYVNAIYVASNARGSYPDTYDNGPEYIKWDVTHSAVDGSARASGKMALAGIVMTVSYAGSKTVNYTAYMRLTDANSGTMTNTWASGTLAPGADTVLQFNGSFSSHISYHAGDRVAYQYAVHVWNNYNSENINLLGSIPMEVN